MIERIYPTTTIRLLGNIELDLALKLEIVCLYSNIHSILWTLFSNGNFREYCILYNSDIIAYAKIMQKIFIFDFMYEKGLHIGNYWTHHLFRWRGFYPYLLRKIVNDYKNRIDKFYIISSIHNISSQKGIIKAGGYVFASGYKIKYGIYKIMDG
jgi:hypothetical protein